MAAQIWLLVIACLSPWMPVDGAQYLGCYVDQGDRDLRERLDTGRVFVVRCDAICSARGFLFFGLQDSNECFCGDNYGRYGVVGGHECNKRCQGDARSFCGSNWRNSLYVSSLADSSGMRYVGCFADGRDRDLPVLASIDNAMSARRCYSLCRSRNFLYFGLQFGHECWCGNDYGKYEQRPENECRKRCAGERTAFCGESWRNSVYATGLRLVQLPPDHYPMSQPFKEQLAAQVRSQQIAFPGGVFCDRCLIAAWNRREADVKSRTFSIHLLDSVMSAYPHKVKEKLTSLRFGARTTFEDFKMTLSGNYAVRSSFIGTAIRTNDNVEMGVVNAEIIAYLVPKHHVFQKEACSRIWFWTKCRTETIRVRIGYQPGEIDLIDQALRSETFRLFAEKLR